jgi:hypothetical protein
MNIENNARPAPIGRELIVMRIASRVQDSR